MIPTDAPPVAAYYNDAINKDAAHPAAARCWMEYIFSDAGQNTWLKGFAPPVRLPAMTTAGTADTAALAAIGSPAAGARSAHGGPGQGGDGLPDPELEVHHHQVAQTH